MITQTKEHIKALLGYDYFEDTNKTIFKDCSPDGYILNCREQLLIIISFDRHIDYTKVINCYHNIDKDFYDKSKNEIYCCLSKHNKKGDFVMKYFRLVNNEDNLLKFEIINETDIIYYFGDETTKITQTENFWDDIENYFTTFDRYNYELLIRLIFDLIHDDDLMRNYYTVYKYMQLEEFIKIVEPKTTDKQKELLKHFINNKEHYDNLFTMIRRFCFKYYNLSLSYILDDDPEW